MIDLFDNPLPPVLKNGKRGKPKVNPLIRHFGKGPEGATCKGCKHQFFKKFSKTYSKCALRGNTGGPATDHSSRYAACGKYEAKPDKKL